jgi:regulatory protein RepA
MSGFIDDFVDQATEDNMDVISAYNLLTTEPPPPDFILEDVLDMGDKLTIIAPSKQRKSLFLLQFALSLAAGRDFLNWHVPKARRVLYVQYEIRDHHFHRRTRKLARAMGIDHDIVGQNLQTISVRGKKEYVGKEGIEKILRTAIKHRSEVIMLDPLYKISEGKENQAEDFKIILSAFDGLAERTGAAIVYVHHDPKGFPGEKNTIDRGSGSNVLGRDYDACFTLTPHANREKDTSVVDVMLRNYPPQDQFTIIFSSTKYQAATGST